MEYDITKHKQYIKNGENFSKLRYEILAESEEESYVTRIYPEEGTYEHRREEYGRWELGEQSCLVPRNLGQKVDRMLDEEEIEVSDQLEPSMASAASD